MWKLNKGVSNSKYGVSDEDGQYDLGRSRLIVSFTPVRSRKTNARAVTVRKSAKLEKNV